MYPAKFDYYRANSVDEAVALLQEHERAKLIAGGHSLLPSMKLRLAQPAALVDLNFIADLRGICRGDDGETTIGAMTTYAAVTDDAAIATTFGALHDAASNIGDIQVRNRGTIGGNLAHNDPGGDLPAVALALDATLHVAGRNGKRRVGAAEFLVGLFEVALAPDEVVTSVSFPAPVAGSGSAYAKFENPASGYAICGIAAYVEVSDGAIRAARVAVNGALDHAQRLAAVEAALSGVGCGDEAAIKAAASKAADGIDEWDFMSDIHADADYRAHLMRVLTAKAVRNACDRATG
ncbi:MAG: xanthine dehydrogenase family protein subunit M [Anaerolineales bacterium]|nr:xanthine dehydrogenase family protein subunit M [Anaerolineales bacterium]